MDDITCSWIPCTDGNPEDFRQLDSEFIKISDVPHSYSGLFIITIKNRYFNKQIYTQVIRRYLNNKWVWLDENNNNIISDNDVIGWFMLPYPNF